MSQAPYRSVLSKPQILAHYRQGSVVIHPFAEENVNSSSVDVRLGQYFYRGQGHVRQGMLLNPFDTKNAQSYWGEPQIAVPASTAQIQESLENISPDDCVILLEPGETILGHTVEFIGGRDVVTTELRAKSSMNRIGLTVSASGGWGDVGFFNRWTLLLTNHLSVPVILVAGMRIAQVVFYQVDPVAEGESYGSSGNYQHSVDVQELVEEWHPGLMLPQMHTDRDIGKFHTFVSEK